MGQKQQQLHKRVTSIYVCVFVMASFACLPAFVVVRSHFTPARSPNALQINISWYTFIYFYLFSILLIPQAVARSTQGLVRCFTFSFSAQTNSFCVSFISSFCYAALSPLLPTTSLPPCLPPALGLINYMQSCCNNNTSSKHCSSFWFPFPITWISFLACVHGFGSSSFAIKLLLLLLLCSPFQDFLLLLFFCTLQLFSHVLCLCHCRTELFAVCLVCPFCQPFPFCCLHHNGSAVFFSFCFRHYATSAAFVLFTLLSYALLKLVVDVFHEVSKEI